MVAISTRPRNTEQSKGGSQGMQNSYIQGRPVTGGGEVGQVRVHSNLLSRGLQRPVTGGGGVEILLGDSSQCHSEKSLPCSLCSKRTRLCSSEVEDTGVPSLPGIKTPLGITSCLGWHGLLRTLGRTLILIFTMSCPFATCETRTDAVAKSLQELVRESGTNPLFFYRRAERA